MIVEIDQSGKLEQLNTATAVAYSDDRSGAVWIRAPTKRKIASYLRKTLKNKADLWPLVFAFVIFHLVAELAPDIVLRIDEEYTGKDRMITDKLSQLLDRRFPNGWRGSIRFGRIGKNSPAHRLAWQVHRLKNRQRVRTLSAEEILRWWA